MGEIEFSEGLMIVNCGSCQGGCELSRKECFLGLSGRFIPGFQGGIILRGVRDHLYEGPMVDALAAHSRILGDIRSLGARKGGMVRSPRSLSKLASDMERAFMRDPGELGSQEKAYRKRMASVLRRGSEKEMELFDSVMESNSLMLRKLERELSRQGND